MHAQGVAGDMKYDGPRSEFMQTAPPPLSIAGCKDNLFHEFLFKKINQPACQTFKKKNNFDQSTRPLFNQFLIANGQSVN